MLMPLLRKSDSIPMCRSAMMRMLSSCRWSAGMFGSGCGFMGFLSQRFCVFFYMLNGRVNIMSRMLSSSGV